MRIQHSYFLAVLILFAAITADASKFRLKNVPEDYAMLEGAIVKKDSQTIIIMTQNGLTTRSIDSIEILEETPREDEKFIKTYGPNNREYQRYLNPEKAQTGMKDKTGETLGYKSIAKPGETYELRYQFERGKLSYCVMDMELEMEARHEDKSIPVTMSMQILMQVLVRSVDRSGTAEILVQVEPKSGAMEFAGMKQKLPHSKLGEKKSGTVSISSTGNIIKNELEDAKANLLPVPDISGNTMSITSLLPEKKVAVGDTWIPSIHIKEETENSTLTMNSTLIDVVDMDGKRIAIIESVIQGNAKDMDFLPDSALPMGGIPMGDQKPSMDMTITRTVTDFHDLDIQNSIKQEEVMNIEMTIKNPETQETSEMKMTGNTTYTIYDKKPQL